MKKIFGAIYVAIVLLSGLQAAAQPTPHHNSQTTSSYIDEPDQSMTHYGGYITIGATPINETHNRNNSAAQSFIPQKEVLTRVQFLMAKHTSASAPCTISLRKELTGPDVTSLEVSTTEFPILNPSDPQASFSWVSFNLTDTWVTAGDTYYLVLYTQNITNNTYYCAGNDSNLYQNGSAFISHDDGTTWQEMPNQGDGCFQTYGLEETFLSLTISNKPFGYSATIKNIGNDTAWDIQINITIKGGILKLIKFESQGTIPKLEPGEELTQRFPNLIGLGPIKIKVTLSAANVKETTISKNALLLILFIILK